MDPVKIPDFSKNVALFGGSFDPPHLAHLEIAKLVSQKIAELDQFFFIPSATSPGKNASVAKDDRLKFLKLSLEGSSFSIWNYELEKGGFSYTIETLEEAHRLGATRDRLYFVMGADCLANFRLWRRYAEILELAQIVVIYRPGFDFKELEIPIVRLELDLDISSTMARESLSQNHIPEGLLAPALESYFRQEILNNSNPYGSSRV